MKRSEYFQGHLSGISYCANDLKEFGIEEYDIAILFSSWDRRCLSVTNAKSLKATSIILVLFDVKDSFGLRDVHDKELVKFAEHSANRIHVLHGNSIEIDAIWSKLSAIILKEHAGPAMPFRIFLDISTAPRIYSTALLANLFQSGLASKISLLYCEAVYPDKDSASEIAFTSGKWRSIVVPGMHGITSPDKKRFYLISVGFEGSKTLQAVSDADPNRISLLFPDPGFNNQYTTRAFDANSTLIKEFAIPETEIVSAPAADAVAAWNALAKDPRERPESENTSYVCCGTKPHSIALTLRAIALRYPRVLYNVPAEHKVVKIEASGVYWKFDFVDMSAINAK